MGKGDKKSKRGKIWIGSYGVTRKRADNKPKYVPSEAAPVAVEVAAKPAARTPRKKAS
jgi:ribosomal small subunit protein bTHX